MSRHSYATFSPVHACFTAAAVALAMLLTGCSGTTTQGVPPSETSTTTALPASAEPSPSVSAAALPTPLVYKPADAHGKAQNVPVPVMPELAKENSEAGLEAFIGYWYAAYSYATETGDTGPWSQSTDVTTVSGIAYRNAIEVNYADGRWVMGGRIRTPVVEVLWQDGTIQQPAKVQVIQEEIHYFRADGSPGQAMSPESNDAEAVMAAYRDGRWLVVDNGLILD
ncbi:DUF6318 family protein [Paenarthrobacter ilicis]|uniref:DUF6318 family protein n=1 Tax=Paenarthrobacter ilicis TaxID=43665 RepID=UPI0028D9040A|nr:DUF6318 family protein [Paenarthrobacter ilicis]